MNTNEATISTRIKVGLFTLAGLIAIGIVTVMVNDRPFWWRSCQLVRISVEDATGLKQKSPVRSMGIDIGYLKSVELSETQVSLGICITAPVEVLPTTRAYIRGEGFLGDKFVELKPVKYTGTHPVVEQNGSYQPSALRLFERFANLLIPQALAADPAPGTASAGAGEDRAARQGGKSRQIPVGESGQDMQALVNRVDSLVNEMTGLTNNLKQAINPEELRSTMRQLNKTLESASRTLSPQSGLNQTAQRTLAKLEDAIEQLRDQMTRINQGKGSVGMLLNDPSYAEEIREAVRNVNKLLGRVGSVRFFIDIGGEKFQGYTDGRGWARLSIWTRPERYYLLGLSVDPRGRQTQTTTTTTVNGISNTTQTIQVETTGLLVTGMVGELFFNHRLDLSIGALNGDAAVSGMLNLGPIGLEDRAQVRLDLYSPRTGNGNGLDARTTLLLRPYKALYVKGGLESFRQVNDKIPFFLGAGVMFEDEDIKILFALR